MRRFIEAIYGPKADRPLAQSAEDPRNQWTKLYRTQPMRPLSFVLTFAFVIGGPLVKYTPRTGLPGAGAFTYTRTPLAIETPQIVAAAAIGAR